MKLWTSMRCDLPPEIQTTCELFLSYENLKISLKLVHKKIDLKLSPLNIINLNFSKNLSMKQDEDAPLPFATLIKMEICIRHNLYLQLCNLIFSYFRIKWNQLFEKQNMQEKKNKKKKHNLIRELSVTLWGGGLKNTALFGLWLFALQQRCFWNFRGKLVSKYFHELLCEKIHASLNSPPLLTPSHFSNDPSFLSYLPSGMRDWNSFHKRLLRYLYLFTKDYNAQDYLNKDGMEATWNKRLEDTVSRQQTVRTFVHIECVTRVIIQPDRLPEDWKA